MIEVLDEVSHHHLWSNHGWTHSVGAHLEQDDSDEGDDGGTEAGTDDDCCDVTAREASLVEFLEFDDNSGGVEGVHGPV